MFMTSWLSENLYTACASAFSLSHIVHTNPMFIYLHRRTLALGRFKFLSLYFQTTHIPRHFLSGCGMLHLACMQLNILKTKTNKHAYKKQKQENRHHRSSGKVWCVSWRSIIMKHWSSLLSFSKTCSSTTLTHFGITSATQKTHYTNAY